jgi:hypothetical protein
LNGNGSNGNGDGPLELLLSTDSLISDLVSLVLKYTRDLNMIVKVRDKGSENGIPIPEHEIQATCDKTLRCEVDQQQNGSRKDLMMNAK